MVNSLVYYGWIIFCLIDFCMRNANTNEDMVLLIADIIVIIGCMICLEIRNLKD